MSVSNNGTDVSHNVQIAVDVISAPADQGQLYNVAKQAAEELGIELKMQKRKC